MRRPRLIIALAVLLALAAVTTLLWEVLDWPPPRLILKYGLPPAGGPTGRSWQNSLGFKFVEIHPGYRHVEWSIVKHEGDWLGRLCACLGIELGQHPEETPWSVHRWVEVEDPYWISTQTVDDASICELEQRALDPTPPYDAWLTAHDKNIYRAPTKQQMLFAAASGVWPSYHLLTHDKQPSVLLGERWQNFHGSEIQFWRTVVTQQATLGNYARSLTLRLPWHEPPLVWVPHRPPQ